MIAVSIHKLSTHFGDVYIAKIMCRDNWYLWYILFKFDIKNTLEFYFYTFSCIFG